MTLTTLTGTISATALNNNFNGKTTAITNANKVTVFNQFDMEVLDLIGTPTNGTNVYDFTSPDDLELWVIGLSVWNPDATARIVTLTLTAIDSNQTAVSKYVLDQTISVSVTANAAAEFNATRDNRQADSSVKVYLMKGVTYRMTFSSNSGTAVDRAYGFILARTRRRRQ